MLLAETRDPVSVSDIVLALAAGGGSASLDGTVTEAPAPPWVPPLAEHLKERRYTDAVRFVLDSHAQGTISSDTDLASRLSESAGAPVAAKLVSAFARFPCRECYNGTDPCPICGGNGIRAERVVCEHCIGSGMIRCDYCGGSGLGAYDLVPIT